MERTLERGDVRLLVHEKETHISEKIQVKDGDKWVSILDTNPDLGALNFWSRHTVYSKPYTYTKRTKKKLYYHLDDEDFNLKLDYCLEEDNILHIRYVLSNKRTLALSKYLINYAIPLGNDPDYTWVPHLRPGEDLVMGDHIYRSPVVIYQKGKFAFALLPDLKTLRQNRPYKSFMDFNLKPNTFRGAPQVSYGFGYYKPVGHILFKHKPLKKWKIKADTDLTFRYYIILFKEKTPQEMLEFINGFLWKKYGTKLLNTSLEPQVLPYDKNAKEGFRAIMERHKIWGDFELDRVPCGGFWQTSWLGKRKSEVAFMDPNEFSIEAQMKENMSKLVSKESLLSKIIMYFANSPFWIRRFEWFTQTFPVIKRNAEVWFNAWFNNMRSAYGFRYFGELWGDEEIKKKGDQILNTFLQIPRVRGVSSSVILPEKLGKTRISEIKGLQGFLYVDRYSLVDCTLSMYWALKYCEDFDVKKEKIHQKAKDLFELLQDIQYENGEMPAYIDFKDDNQTPIISEVLKDSASSGTHLMFLTEYFKCSNNSETIPLMEKIAHYIQEDIIPADKWHDFEPFYSCTHLPVDFYDDYTNSHVMNGLCIYWCAEGFKELYKITRKPAYLQSGERILAILSLFQQVWDAPYIGFHTFGGFCSQNIDAELSDARQGLFVRVYMEYYLLTGKSEYMERAIAGLRGSWAMQLLKEYEDLCPGNVKGIKTVEGVDRGIVFENYGHSGTDTRVPGYWMPDWGFGTSLSATAYVKKHFGDIFIDFNENKVFGIDGILLTDYKFDDQKVILTCEIIPKKDYVLFKSRKAPENPQIILNDHILGPLNKAELEKGFHYKLNS